VRVWGTPDAARVQVDDGPVQPASVVLREGRATIAIDDALRTVVVGADMLSADGATFRVTERRTERTGEDAAGASPQLVSPMPGTVVLVGAADGTRVEPGDPVVVVEAMKMEHVLRAAVAGTVRVRVAVGDQVTRGGVVATVEPDDEEQR